MTRTTEINSFVSCKDSIIDDLLRGRFPSDSNCSRGQRGQVFRVPQENAVEPDVSKGLEVPFSSQKYWLKIVLYLGLEGENDIIQMWLLVWMKVGEVPPVTRRYYAKWDLVCFYLKDLRIEQNAEGGFLSGCRDSECDRSQVITVFAFL